MPFLSSSTAQHAFAFPAFCPTFSQHPVVHCRHHAPEHGLPCPHSNAPVANRSCALPAIAGTAITATSSTVPNAVTPICCWRSSAAPGHRGTTRPWCRRARLFLSWAVISHWQMPCSLTSRMKNPPGWISAVAKAGTPSSLPSGWAA